MTETVVVSGPPTEDTSAKIRQQRDVPPMRYGRHGKAARSTYSIPVSGGLVAIVTPSEEGWIAQAPALKALGHGDTPESALDSLRDALEQYVEFIRDDKPRLAPDIAWHKIYVRLLDLPRQAWFASVTVDAPAVE